MVPFLVATAARYEGFAPEGILGPAGLGHEAPPRPEAHVRAEVYLDVWRRVMALIPDAAFPLRAASAFKLEDHELFGFLAMSCETLGQAYERTATYRALYCVGARWELQNDPSAMRVIWYPWPGEVDDIGYRAAMDYSVADMANAIRRLGCSGPRPTSVHLMHGAPGDTSAFVEHYGVEPTFDRLLYELVYPPGTQDMPVNTFNSRLRDYFDAECGRMMGSVGASPTVVDQVRKKLIGVMDGGATSMEAMAKKLGMSARSLQRKLSEEGTGYNDLLAQIRAEFAKRYLSRGTLSASEVAYLIGFTEPPAFFKAFKRWTGMTPTEFQHGAVAAQA